MTARYHRLPVLALLLPALITAGANLFSNRFGDFCAGALQPLTTFQHAVPWLALGILAGMQDPRIGRWLILAFPLGLIAGSALALAVPQEILVSTVNVASFAVIGLLVAVSWPLPPAVLIGLGWLFGLTHGYENGTAMTTETNPVLFIPGIAAAGCVIMALAIAATNAFLRGSAAWRRVGLRAFGSWVGAAGIMLIGLRLIGR